MNNVDGTPPDREASLIPVVSRSWFALYHGTTTKQELSGVCRVARFLYQGTEHKSNPDSKAEQTADYKCATQVPGRTDVYSFVLETNVIESEHENIEECHDEVDERKTTGPHSKAENRRIALYRMINDFAREVSTPGNE